MELEMRIKAVPTMYVVACLLFAPAWAAGQSGFNFDDAYYTGIALDVSPFTSNTRTTSWNPDGTAMYIVGRSTQNVVAYELAQPWNLATASYKNQFDLSNELGTQTQETSVAHGLYLRDDGARMWVFNRIEIWAYDLATPWDVTTAHQPVHADYSAFVARGHDIDFRPDGTQLFVCDQTTKNVHVVNLATPWDITTSSWQATLDLSAQVDALRGVELIRDGNVMLVLDTGRKEILQYDLAVPYDLMTATYVGVFDLSGQTDDPRGLSLDPQATRFFVTGTDNGAVYQYIIPEPASLVLLGLGGVMLLRRRRRN
jgi:DNA-binding beta-propeller fold protein YncE